ncbi:MAG TPA: tetratricopeptide repeat protein [Thermotogota bacterium]|nr:tetratricopeptide repeat protein [Thermotogota bacterium]
MAMIKLTLNDRMISLDEWAPYFFIIRDLFFDGRWDSFMCIVSDNPLMEEQIETCKKIEKLYPEIKAELFYPTTPMEIRDFFKEYHIKLSVMKDLCSLDTLYDIANEALLDEDFELTLEYAQLIMDIDDSSAYAYDLKGTVLFDQGKTKKSIENLEKAIKLDDGLLEAFSTLGQAYFNVHEYEKAASIWKKMIKKNPDDVLAYFTLVDAYLHQKKFQDAISVLKDLIERFPKHLMGKINLITILQMIGENKLAEQYEKEIEQTKPLNPTELEIWARMNLQKGKYSVVEDGIKKYLDLHGGPDFLNLWLVVPYIKNGKKKQAMEIVNAFKGSNMLFNYGKHEIFDPFLEESEIWECGLPC